ncbi:hypothetical protein G5I_12825 [Acromyrmex echinatior]|uniref:Mpv17-like protein n=1 Tax=Acromyrmex echinatior TaxID=103372 RepID=F4X3D1_ACREC|nr:hypothetical protein G5I_12825 [Acromyrmex echinatior]
MSLTKALRVVSSIMQKRPLLFNSMVYGFFYTSAEFIQQSFTKMSKTSCGYWLPVQFVNFLLIPPSFRVTYVSIAAFCWVNILCYLKNLPVSEHEQKIKY